MQVFPIILITKRYFDLKRTYCVNVKLDGEFNNVRETCNSAVSITEITPKYATIHLNFKNVQVINIYVFVLKKTNT